MRLLDVAGQCSCHNIYTKVNIIFTQNRIYLIKIETVNMSTCKLCLKISETDLEGLGDTTQEILNFLMINLDLSTSQDTVVCSGCIKDLKICFTFRKEYLDKRNGTLIKRKDVLPPVATMSEYVTNVDISVDKNDVCYFCMEYSALSIFLMNVEVTAAEVLKKCFPELHMSVAETSAICKSCYKSLQKYIAIMSRYLPVKKEIKESSEVEINSSIDQMEAKDVHIIPEEKLLKDVPVLLSSVKMEPTDIYENTKIQNEGLTETENQQLYYIKSEDIDIKTEDDGDDSNGEDPTSGKLLKKANYGCEMCTYQTAHKSDFQTHMLTHKNTSKFPLYKCMICQFQTKYKNNFKRHTLTHKSVADVTMYECDMCEYRSKFRRYLRRHKQRHTGATKVTIYKCETCYFHTKYKKSLKQHALTHKNASDVTMYQCDMCEYRTKQRQNLSRHQQTHKSDAEVTLYKCDTCEYQTRRKDVLQAHMLNHKRTLSRTACDETTSAYKCYICSFETSFKNSLVRHMLTHRSPAEVSVYKCDICAFRSKRKEVLSNHMLTHQTGAEVATYAFEKCPDNMYKDNFKRHTLIYTSVSEAALFKCTKCTFQTKYKKSLKRHASIHKTV